MDPGNRTLLVAQNLRMLLTNVLLIVIYLHQGNSFLTGGTASKGEVVPSYSTLIEGSNLTLNCTLKSYSATPLRSSALYFVAVYLNNPQVVDAGFYHVLSRQTLQLVIPNVKREDGNVFKCYMNDSDLKNSSDTPIGSATVDIGRPPNPIVNVSVVSDNFENMTVSWCPTVSQVDPVDSHLSWAIDSIQLSGNCSVWKITSTSAKHCSCIFCGTSASLSCSGKPQTYHNFQTYKMTITSFNTYGSTTTSLQFYTDSTIVKPRPVGELVVTPLSSRSLQASWIYPVGLDPLVLPLMFWINVFSEWGLNSTIDAGPSTSWVITDLTPGTLYTVAVRCKPPDGGYWSDDSMASAKTMEDVPAVAPESPTGFFRTSVCLEKDGCPVTIFWKLINASLQSGVILGYRLTIESTLCTNSCKIDVNDGYATSVDIGLAEGVSSWVRLVAYTSVGESPPHYIFFPPQFRTLPNIEVQGLYAEYTEDKTGIFFSWNYDDNVDNHTLMYCAGKQTDKTHCLSSPVNATLLRDQTNFTISPFNRDHVYAMSSNYRNGTSGLTPNWICIYEYSGSPAMPVLKSTTQVSDTSVKVVWSPLTCTTDNNRVRVLNYTLSYINDSMLDNISITLPGNVTEYTITDLTPEVEYTFTLRGVSRSGPGLPTTAAIITDPAKPVSIVVPVAVSVTLAVVVVIVIFGAV